MNNQAAPPITGLILDMDGVLWKDKHPIGNLKEIFSEILRHGYQYAFATNNSTSTPEQYAQILNEFSVPAEEAQVFNSAITVAAMVRENFPNDDGVYIVGEQGLVQALERQGFHHTRENPAAVVVGMDRKLTYSKLSEAALCIQRGAVFYGTNPDTSYPSPEGLLPGAGSIIGAVQIATGQTPIYAGKPSPEMMKLAIRHLGLPPSQILVIGDRIETDIAGGKNAGCKTGLVLSGISTAEEAKISDIKPDMISDDLESLIRELIDAR